VQRVLRESGFTQVEVMGRTGDGGIDGRGIVRIHRLMSFHVLFSVQVLQGVRAGGRDQRLPRDNGRTDKGLFISTGTFSPSAVREATRDGVPPIDLIDGAELAEKLKELGLGLRLETVEVPRVDVKWFEGI
jgi:restriction system protein